MSTKPKRPSLAWWGDFYKASKLILTLNCPQSAELCSKELDQELSRVEWIAVKAHLMVCKQSRVFRRQIRKLNEILAGSLDGQEKNLTDSSKQRLKNRIEKELHRTNRENRENRD